MPSFPQALLILLASVLTTWPITTDGGRSNRQQRRAGKNKNSKKQNVVVQQCTLDQFVGDYKYIDFKNKETKVGITCDKDNGTKNLCNYQETPLNNDNGDNDGYVVQGSFDATQIWMDPTRPGVCLHCKYDWQCHCKANEKRCCDQGMCWDTNYGNDDY